MTTNTNILIAYFIAYLFGSLSSAVVVCHLMRLPDPRTQGSKNPGATNVLRLGGGKAAFLTLTGDMLKGLIPVLLAQLYGFSAFESSLVALGTFLGHLYPIFFGFKGGKGVATTLGAVAALNGWLSLAMIATWLLTAVIFRYSSLAALMMMVGAPLYAAYWLNLPSALVVGVMSIILIIRHKQNIQKLIAGTENKIGKKA